jgi:CubicO group peptidase (beta-lactamase class C family)
LKLAIGEDLAHGGIVMVTRRPPYRAQAPLANPWHGDSLRAGRALAGPAFGLRWRTTGGKAAFTPSHGRDQSASRRPASAGAGGGRIVHRLALGETRALVVMHKGRIVAERYAPGYGPNTKLIGWSMSKTITGVLIGLLISDGRLTLDESAPVPTWQRPGDPRGEITLRQLLQMRSGLQHVESTKPAAMPIRCACWCWTGATTPPPMPRPSP